MYKKILVPLENTDTDRAIIDHIKQLAKIHGSQVALLHVATGIPAQYHGAEAAGKEVEEDRAFLQRVQREFEGEGLGVSAELGFGDPAKEIIRWVHEHQCDLVAMSTHGHRFIADLVFGATASQVQHRIHVPVLLLRATA